MKKNKKYFFDEKGNLDSKLLEEKINKSLSESPDIKKLLEKLSKI